MPLIIFCLFNESKRDEFRVRLVSRGAQIKKVQTQNINLNFRIRFFLNFYKILSNDRTFKVVLKICKIQ